MAPCATPEKVKFYSCIMAIPRGQIVGMHVRKNKRGGSEDPPLAFMPAYGDTVTVCESVVGKLAKPDAVAVTVVVPAPTGSNATPPAATLVGV